VQNRLTVVLFALFGLVSGSVVVCGAGVVLVASIRRSRNDAVRSNMSPAVRSILSHAIRSNVDGEVCHDEGVKVEDGAQIFKKCEAMK
jgi:hypothetical protein